MMDAGKELPWLGIILCQVSLLCASPIQFPVDNNILANPFIPKDFCILPPDYGTQGSTKFLEECDSLDQFDSLPIPGQNYQKLGTHPIVCCPPKIYKEDFICFPTDAWCPIYKKIVLPDLPPPQTVAPVITMANRTCYNTPLGDGRVLSNCVPINRCAQLLDTYPSAPITVTQPCGFDEESSSLMICCPEEFTTDPVEIAQEPRFPVGNKPGGEARRCSDKHELCTRWKDNGGCALDQNFVISEEDGNGRVSSADMFGFMQGACAESCEWCGSKGCVDEHPKCIEWSRSGACVQNPFVMTHMCRESCGVCGFLSPENTEDQVKDGKSYSDFTKDNFDCGRYKLLTEINGDDFEAETVKPIEGKPAEPLEIENEIDTDDIDLRTADVFFSSDGDPTEFFCGATMVNDRWVVAASHCYDDFGASASIGPRQVKINTIRDNTEYKELVEIKRVFKHPLYKYPNLYNDVALLELGRRVEYNYEVYGDTPSCLDQGMEKEGKLATIQGYGLTETGERGTLLEANVTIISNAQCKEQLDFNTTNNKVARKQIDQALPQGLNYGLLCAQGEKNEDGIYRGSCKGDSGGPLTSLNEKQRTTLVGIVSGGIGCGLGFPGWYTKVEFYAKWIQCIIDTSKTMTIKKDIEEACVKQTEKLKKCQDIEPDDLIFGDLRSVDDEDEAQCNEDGTFNSDTKYQPVFDPIFGP
eukprot:GFUD01041055.1.p1 GENE.GFUD01041055.1~~GFUD01041055.1.p1  ORF type:complete len:698 (+),score=145.05 GFUD01041055.1:85-2178(+)